MEVKITLICAVALVAIALGAQNCNIATNRQCQETRRKALELPTQSPERILVLSQVCM
jgi:hypothetical protein